MGSPVPSDVSHDRVALDETSLDFRGVPQSELEGMLDHLNDTLSQLHRAGLSVTTHPALWTDVECLDQCSIADFLFSRGVTPVGRDTRQRLAILLDRCPTWTGDELSAIESVTIAPTASAREERSTTPAAPEHLDVPLSVGIALARAHVRVMACLVFVGARRRGWWSVSGLPGAPETYFFAVATELTSFWRSLFKRESVPEHRFRQLAAWAFPRLALHPAADFRRFDGHYRDLRDTVVRVLEVLNDHFPDAIGYRQKTPAMIQAVLGSHGVDASLESPSTRGSGKLISQRDVTWDGATVRCEWHAKLEPHRNRIHFSEPLPDGRVLVGIFTDHLGTMSKNR